MTKFESIRNDVKNAVRKGSKKLVVDVFAKVKVIRNLKKQQMKYNYLRNALKVTSFKFKTIKARLYLVA